MTTDLQKVVAWAEENPRTAERIDLAAHLATATWSEQCYLAVEDHTVDLHQHIAHLIAAGDAVIASLRAAAARCGTCAHSETVSPSVSHLWCHVHDQARAPNDGCRLGYAPKETP